MFGLLSDKTTGSVAWLGDISLSSHSESIASKGSTKTTRRGGELKIDVN